MKAIYGVGVAVLALLVLAGAATLVQANLAPAPDPMFTEPPYNTPPEAYPVYPTPYIPPQPSYSVQTMQGFAMDAGSLDYEPVVFVRLSYGSRESAYLFVGDEFHRLRLVERRWVENGEAARYSVEGMDAGLTLYSRDGFYSSASGVLGERILVFEPAYRMYPAYGQQTNMSAGGQPVDGVVCGSVENQVIGPEGITCKE